MPETTLLLSFSTRADLRFTMKRNASLVAYDSSDEEVNENSTPTDNLSSAPSMPKRKLPKLSPSLMTPSPKSDPSQHQGRIRSSPHVEGQFAAYVYIPVPFDDNEKLKNHLTSVVRRAKELVPELVCDWTNLDSEQNNMPSKASQGSELHISLTRPIYIRHYQREELKRAVKAVAQNYSPFSASFSSFATFDNDERTRTFLGVEIGAGHSDFESLSKALGPALKLLHQKSFYEKPRFHASIAWALLERTSVEHTDLDISSPHPPFPTISAFPLDMLTRLTEDFGRTLTTKIGAVEVDQLKLKIGKDTFSWLFPG